MTSADDRLKALFAADAPPAHDPAFQAAVMAAVMRREFAADMLLLAGTTLVGGAGLWALWPTIHPTLVALSQEFAPLAAVLALAAGAVVVLGARPRVALGLET